MLGKPVDFSKRSAKNIKGKVLPSVDEQIDIVDEDENVIDTVGFKEAHEKGYLHRFCRVLLMNQKGDFILHTVDKALKNSGKIDAPGGHLDAGECYVNAALRELHEEMGIEVIASELIQLGKIEDRKNPSYENMIGRAFLAIHDGPYIVEEGEIDEVFAFSPDELESFITTNPNQFTTKLKQTFELWKQYKNRK